MSKARSFFGKVLAGIFGLAFVLGLAAITLKVAAEVYLAFKTNPAAAIAVTSWFAPFGVLALVAGMQAKLISGASDVREEMIRQIGNQNRRIADLERQVEILDVDHSVLLHDLEQQGVYIGRP